MAAPLQFIFVGLAPLQLIVVGLDLQQPPWNVELGPQHFIVVGFAP